MAKPRVLISDKLSPAAVEIFKTRGVDADPQAEEHGEQRDRQLRGGGVVDAPLVAEPVGYFSSEVSWSSTACSCALTCLPPIPRNPPSLVAWAVAFAALRIMAL